MAGDDVVGYAGLAVFGDEAHVHTIGVAGAAQRRGLGATLLRDLLAAAGDRRVLLEVRADNEAAQRLYGGTASCRSAAAGATTSRARSTRW